MEWSVSDSVIRSESIKFITRYEPLLFLSLYSNFLFTIATPTFGTSLKKKLIPLGMDKVSLRFSTHFLCGFI